MDTVNLADSIPITTYASQASTDLVPTIGAAYAGGFVGAIIPWTDNRQAIVIVADKTEGGDLDDLEWDPDYNSSPGATSFLDGLANSNSVNDDGHPAAKAARDFKGGGFDDWHLPAHAVQTALLANLCPIWTMVELFKEGGAQAYEKSDYWSSTESQFDSDCAWSQSFGNGSSYDWGKGNGARVRPVRIILI